MLRASHARVFAVAWHPIAQTSEVLCANNITILKLLRYARLAGAACMRRCMTARVWCARRVFATRSEEVFDFGKTDMTSAKIEHLKKTLNAEFAQIFQLCEYILRYAAALPRAAGLSVHAALPGVVVAARSNSTKKELLEATLQTLLRFMSWIPLGYIFQTQLVELLVMKFFASPAFRCDALHCLNEIACLETSGVPAHDRVLEQLFVGAMNVLVTHIPPGADIRRGFSAGREEEKLLIQRLSLFFANFFKVRGCVAACCGSPTPVARLTAGARPILSLLRRSTT